MAGGSQTTALDAREMLAHAVHLANRRAALQQRLVDALLLGQVNAFGGQRQQGGAAAGDQADHQIIGRQALGQRQNALGRSQTGRVRHGVGGFHHLQALGQPFGAWGNMCIARHHQARQWRILRPQSFQRLRHGAAGLAGAQHQRAALGRLGQMTRQTLDGQGIAHRHVIQMTQKASRVLLGNRRCRGLRARGCILCLHSCALCIRAFFPYRGPPVTTLLIFAIPMLQALAPIGFARLRTAFCA